MKMIMTINKKTKAKTIEYKDEPDGIDFERFGMSLVDDFLEWSKKQKDRELEPVMV